MPSQAEIQESITNRIIEGLQNGIVPWRKPWKNDPNCGPATNVVSKRTYRTDRHGSRRRKSPAQDLTSRN